MQEVCVCIADEPLKNYLNDYDVDDWDGNLQVIKSRRQVVASSSYDYHVLNVNLQHHISKQVTERETKWSRIEYC